jgi:hypothetical protein
MWIEGRRKNKMEKIKLIIGNGIIRNEIRDEI